MEEKKYSALCFNEEKGMTKSIQEKNTLEKAWQNETPFMYKGYLVQICKNTGYSDTYIMRQYTPKNEEEWEQRKHRIIERRRKGINENFNELFYTPLKEN